MKRLILLLVVALVGFAAIAIATEADLTQRQVRDPRQLAVILDDRTIVQTDAAATNTATTSYTPSRIGQLLSGKLLTTNKVWVSTGLTTNDWALITN